MARRPQALGHHWGCPEQWWSRPSALRRAAEADLGPAANTVWLRQTYLFTLRFRLLPVFVHPLHLPVRTHSIPPPARPDGRKTSYLRESHAECPARGVGSAGCYAG